MSKPRRALPGSNSGSMADIAFLLLIFFMITTTVANDKGLSLLLPIVPPEDIIVEIPDRNIFKIQLNSTDQVMVEGEIRSSMNGLRVEIKDFILNFGKNKDLSDSPAKAIISIKTKRGTSQQAFISALDEAKAAYYQIYAERVGITPERYRNLTQIDPVEKQLYENGKRDIPLRISIAEPDK